MNKNQKIEKENNRLKNKRDLKRENNEHD